MNRAVASFIAAFATFIGLLSLFPASRNRQLVRTEDGRFYVQQGDEPKRLQLNNPLLAKVSETEAILRWRLQYARHYTMMDQIRSEKIASADEQVLDNNQSSANRFDVAPAGFKSASGLANNAVTGASQENDSRTYWQLLSEQTERHLARLETSKMAAMKQGNAADAAISSQPVEKLSTLPSNPPWQLLVFVLGSALGIAAVRWCLEPELENDLKVQAIQHAWDEELPNATGEELSCASNCAVLTIVVPASWITAKRFSRRVIEFDRLTFWTAVGLLMALLWNATQEPFGFKRLLWWPLAEVYGMWG